MAAQVTAVGVVFVAAVVLTGAAQVVPVRFTPGGGVTVMPLIATGPVLVMVMVTGTTLPSVAGAVCDAVVVPVTVTTPSLRVTVLSVPARRPAVVDTAVALRLTVPAVMSVAFSVADTTHFR